MELKNCQIDNYTAFNIHNLQEKRKYIQVNVTLSAEVSKKDLQKLHILKERNEKFNLEGEV